jgi:hypothetical protein
MGGTHAPGLCDGRAGLSPLWGRMRLIATIHDPSVIRRSLAHLGLSHAGQSPGPAPPEPSAAAP